MSHWKGQPLERLPLSEREVKFADGFPGKVARFTSGEHQYVIRLGAPQDETTSSSSRLFFAGRAIPSDRCRFELKATVNVGAASRPPGRAKRSDVCERIFDHDGNAWTDVSAWYWAATMGQSAGPWWAVTRVAAKP